MIDENQKERAPTRPRLRVSISEAPEHGICTQDIQSGAKVRTHLPSQAAKMYQRGKRPFEYLK
jgi:hypothetical protein